MKIPEAKVHVMGPDKTSLREKTKWPFRAERLIMD